jgi:two-component system, NarL family, nitrate/nitrite response regulator NarL
MSRVISLEPSRTSIRVLVADSTQLTGHLITQALRKDRGLTISNAEANSIVASATTLKPDVALISEQLEGKPGKGFDVLRELRVAAPTTRIVMLLDSAERELVVEAFRNGARGIFCRNDPVKMLTLCIRRVREGQLWVSNYQLEFLLEALAQTRATRLVDAQGRELLSKRERDVVRWVTGGYSNTEIARRMNLSDNTVKNYLLHIYNKLGVSGRVELVVYAANQSRGGQMKFEETV